MRRLLPLVSSLILVACGDKDGGEVDDAAPAVRIVTPVDGAAFEPGETLVLCLDLDDDGPVDALELTVASDVDGVVWSGAPAGSCGGGDATVSLVLSDAPHTLVVTVEDPGEHAAEDRVVVVPTPNTDPWCTIEQPTDGQQVDLDEGARFSATVGDDGTLLHHLFVVMDSDVDGTLWTGAPDDDGVVEVDWRPDEEGSHQLSVEVRDARGATATCGVKVEVTRCQDVDEDGWTTCEGDCDDADPAVHPGADETWYDGVDQDCAGDSDLDADGDGWDARDHGGEDCDDTDAAVYPDAVETWYDGVDSDCAGDSDDDADADGWDARAFGGEDCDDGDPTVNPDAVEVWYDGVDQDCSGRSDYDADRDGADSDAWGGTDCDDDDDTIGPFVEEVWYDGVDQDCDGESDYDADRDGWDADPYGGEDCDDGSDLVFPGADERRNAADDDCDGYCDEGLIDPGDLVITEIMKDPAESTDEDGEWIELYNASGVDLRLCSGWTLTDAEDDSSDLDSDLLIPAGGYVVLGRSDDETVNGGYTPDALVEDAFRLGNGGDQVYLSFDDDLIDAVEYSGGGAWPDPLGASLSLDPDWLDADDNDDGANWCAGATAFGLGDLGTPGTANDEC